MASPRPEPGAKHLRLDTAHESGEEGGARAAGPEQEQDLDPNRTPSPSNPPVSFEVRPRDFYIYYVTVEHPGDLLKWSFYTKKKNVAFGMFYLHSLGTTGPARPAADEARVQQAIDESKVFATIWPPPKGTPGVGASGSLSRSNSQLSRAMGSSDGSLAATPLLGASLNTSAAQLLIPDVAPQANQADFMLATQAFGQGGAEGGEGAHPFRFIEVLPVDKYESYETTINGSYKVPIGGVYALCFDNSFSINTSKQVFLGLKVVPAALLADCGVASHDLPFIGGLGAQDEGILMNGWLMKKKRKTIQGWAKRWVQLEGNGMLSYYASRDGSCRGNIDVRKSTVARVPNRRLITIDSSETTFHLRALTAEEFAAWTAALNTFLLAAPAAPPAAQAAGRSTARLARIDSYEADIAGGITQMQAAVEELRDLARATDDGALAQYIGPLEQTCQSLGELFAMVCGYAAHLKALREEGVFRAAAAAHADALEDSGLEDVFYDLELSDYSDESESEYADAEEAPERAPALSAPVAVLPPSSVSHYEVQYRSCLPAPAPPCTISLGSILRKSIGKDSSGVVMPMGLNEPLNGLQRLCEELEYADLLDRAAAEADPLERLVHIAAFAVSAYNSCQHRADRKPFNPMLGETYEYVDPAKRIRFVAEKVSHRPLVLACHAAAPAWEFWQDQKVKTKFWGKSMEYIPSGTVNVRFANGDHFQWSKVISCLRNVLGSNKYIDNYGEMAITNARTGDTATITFKSSGGFFGGSSTPNEVVGVVQSHDRARAIRLSGRWDNLLMRETPTGRLEVIWQASPFPPFHQDYYGLTYFALRLNQLLPGQAETLPPSDTRLRPDQRLLEEARVDSAEAEMMRLVEKQRQARAEMEAAGTEWQPLWFAPDGDSWAFKGDYWDAKEKRDWANVPQLW